MLRLIIIFELLELNFKMSYFGVKKKRYSRKAKKALSESY